MTAVKSAVYCAREIMWLHPSYGYDAEMLKFPCLNVIYVICVDPLFIYLFIFAYGTVHIVH